MAKNIIDYIVFGLDTHRIVGFRLKSWADQFIIVEAKLYEDNAVVNKNSPGESLDEDNGVAPCIYGASIHMITLVERQYLRASV